MKQIAIGIAAIAAMIGTPAVAADMAVKAPPSVSASAYSWTSCYIGGNGGYLWNNSTSSYHDPNSTLDPINGSTNTTFTPPQGQIPAPNAANGRGWIGGGEVGCNWQMDPRVVLGLEADIDAMHMSRSASTFAGGPLTGIFAGMNNFQVGGTDVVGVGTASEQVSLHWLSTIRARAGLPLLSDRGLLFVTGGLAVGGVSSSGSVTVVTPGFRTQAAWAGSNSSTQTGWTVGGGFEYVLSDHWTAKTEYLYYDLGNASHPLNLGLDNVGGSYPTLGNTVTPIRGSVIRVGLNYLFK